MISPDIITEGWSYKHPLTLAKHKTAAMLISGAFLLLLCWLDYITGYEFGFFIFYFIPVAFAAWYGGRKEGIVMAVLCGIFWYISDRLTHHPYSRPFFIYWETFMRLVSFLTTSLTLSRIRDLVLNEETLATELLAVREELDQLRQPPSSLEADLHIPEDESQSGHPLTREHLPENDYAANQTRD